jgi:hypothetical protein
MAKKEIKKCLNCKKEISENNNYTQILSFSNGKITENVYFHMSCWKDCFNQKVNEKMKNQVKFIQDQAVHLFDHPMIKGLLEQVKGSKMTLNMLKLPLNPDKLVSKELVKRKIQDGRKKRSQKRRKA